MSNYTLRIWTNGEGAFGDQDFETLDELYNSIFTDWHPEVLPLENARVNLDNGWAVYDNIEDLCINSVNAQQVGHTKADPWQPMTA